MVSVVQPVIAGHAFALMHVPGLVRYGSKPRREIARSPEMLTRLSAHLRSFDAANRYPPNQTYIGNLTPTALAQLARPWFEGAQQDAVRPDGQGRFGAIVPETTFIGMLHAADVLEPALVAPSAAGARKLQSALAADAVLKPFADASARRRHNSPPAVCDGHPELELTAYGEIVGQMRGDRRTEGRDDPNLDACTLLEALCAKASGAIAVAHLLHRTGLDATSVDYLISCGEEACGDRYQRGAGGLAKAVAQMCGCSRASGMDIKNFCAGPASALATAGALVKAGLYERVIVFAGGSLAKLGMKFQAFTAAGIPVLDDCLGAMAFLVTRDDGVSPVLRLEPGAIGTTPVSASTSDEAIYRELILKPLAALGLRLADIDRFAPELHNPEIMEHSGSGDVTYKNYRMIAATAVRAGIIDKPGMNDFLKRVSMPGFAPTQGHIPSGVPYVGHAVDAMQGGEIKRVMFVCKASIFLNRLTELWDGVSFVLEKNPAIDP